MYIHYCGAIPVSISIDFLFGSGPKLAIKKWSMFWLLI
jgi:hypothetical protein